MVAEKRGRIRLYDLSTEVPIQSLDAPFPPLLSVDWSPTNPLAVGGVCTGDWCIWDLSKSRYRHTNSTKIIVVKDSGRFFNAVSHWLENLYPKDSLPNSGKYSTMSNTMILFTHVLCVDI